MRRWLGKSRAPADTSGVAFIAWDVALSYYPYHSAIVSMPGVDPPHPCMIKVTLGLILHDKSDVGVDLLSP